MKSDNWEQKKLKVNFFTGNFIFLPVPKVES